MEATMLKLTRLANVPSVYVRVLVLIVLLAAALAMAFKSGRVVAAPKAISSEECRLIGTVAIVSRALAVEKIPEEQAARVLGQVFTIPDERAAALVSSVLSTAYRADVPAGVFSGALIRTCLRTGGDMDAILGRDT
jgi:hypothetical protein